MKNYDIKCATADLSLKQKVKFSMHRLAYLVSNMYSRVSKGYNVKVEELKKSIKIASEQAEIEKEAVAEEKAANIEERIQAKEEAIVQVKQSAVIPDNDKSYIVKGHAEDIDALREKQAKVLTAPRKLLISKIFLQKLIVNRKNKIIQRREDKAIEKELNNIPSVEEEHSVNDIGYAKRRYIELNNEFYECDARIKKVKEEMIKLVNQYGLTREMVEENLENRQDIETTEKTK